ncbi:unnamed protein product [Polarella glacialis]|nr:unnamed protein product [Polarella glacialis]
MQRRSMMEKSPSGSQDLGNTLGSRSVRDRRPSGGGELAEPRGPFAGPAVQLLLLSPSGAPSEQQAAFDQLAIATTATRRRLLQAATAAVSRVPDDDEHRDTDRSRSCGAFSSAVSLAAEAELLQVLIDLIDLDEGWASEAEDRPAVAVPVEGGEHKAALEAALSKTLPLRFLSLRAGTVKESLPHAGSLQGSSTQDLSDGELAQQLVDFAFDTKTAS